MNRKELLLGLKNNISILEDFIDSIPEEFVYRKMGKGFWTIHQHISHLADVQQKIYGRLELFLEDNRPVIKPINPDKDTENQNDTRTIKELLSSFKKLRMMQITLARKSPDEIWKRKIEHPEYRLYTFEIAFRHMILHDGFHMYRIEELWLMKDEFLSPL